MSLRCLEYGIGESLIGIRRNPLMSIASILTVAVTLSILGGFVLFALGLNRGTETELKKFEMAVWLDSAKTDADIVEIRARIKSLPNVALVEFVPAEKTWEKIKREQGDEIVGSVDPDAVLGDLDSFKVKVRNPRYTVRTAEAIRRLPHISEVREGRQVVEKIVRLADILKIVGIATAGILLLVAGFLISNTIRLTVYARRREIKIMQMVGATNWFIRLPLLLEGTTLGIIGAGIACLLVYGTSYYASEWVLKTMPMLKLFSSNADPLQFFGGMIVLGWFIGMFGSLVSIQRFLKVSH
jgi:cell division transport system permease protein